MEALDFDHTVFEKSRQSEADKALAVKFLVRPFQDQAATLREGRPVFIEREYIDIKGPGTHICRPAEQRDIYRFPEHYRLFKARINTDDVVQGTPLRDWAPMTRAQAEELAFLNIKTVEQLAATSDVMSGKIMNFHAIKRKAQDWLEVSKNNAAALQLKEELHKRDLQIEALQKQVQQLLEAKPVPVAATGPVATDTVTMTPDQVRQMIADALAVASPVVVEQPKAKLGRKPNPFKPPKQTE